MRYEISATINLPDGEEVVDVAFIDVPLKDIIMFLEHDYPDMTSFMLTFVPIK